MTVHKLWPVVALGAIAAFLAFLVSPATDPAGAADAAAPVASGWTIIKSPATQPVCDAGYPGGTHFQRLECGYAYVTVSGTKLSTPNRSVVTISTLDRDGKVLETQIGLSRTQGWLFSIKPQRVPTPWPAGPITYRVTAVDADGEGPGPTQTGNFGEMTIVLNALGARVTPGGGIHKPGDRIPVTGSVFAIEQPSFPLLTATEIPVPATLQLQVRTPDGEVRGPYGPFTADAEGHFQAELPPAATAGITATADTNFKVTAAIEVVNASYDDPASGPWESARAGAGGVALVTAPTSLTIENSYVSDVGWVKPGETYPFRVVVRNYTPTTATGAKVTLPSPDGTTLTSASADTGSGSATVSGGTVTWNIGSVPAAIDGVPGIKSLLVEGRADTLGQDARVVWKNLSSIATLTYDGGPTLKSKSKGPKVIPPKATYETARYGHRPFAVVPADYFDRKHARAHTGEALSDKVNSPDVPGSTFNLYQEMSYGQLFPNGTVPSAGITTASWNVQWNSDRYKQSGFRFTEPKVQGACTGTTFKGFTGSAVYAERIKDGWYQLPGDTGYYGSDVNSFANVARPNVAFIDQACGPIGKAVYDAAHIADPEIDYSDYDTDKDGVVDFFMLVFAGAGGNGVSQTSAPPYDNIWPHSSSLEGQYTDPATGLKGYVSDDQLKDLRGQPLYYTDSSRSRMTTTVTDHPVYVRVGPYNVNPEAAIDRASVISHEYGHSLGLPDYYSSSGSGRTTYGDWNLMATDKSQHMDVNAKQELGWLVPRVLQPGQTDVNGWRDSKVNTHRIDWVQPDGTPYTLTGDDVNNGEAYVAKLPGRIILDSSKVPSGDHVWWSGSGNDFDCVPDKGRNIDLYLPRLKELALGTPVTLTFKSYWHIEWDYDYGYVMAALQDGNAVDYESLPSQKGYTTPASQNPNGIGCQGTYGNGITGTSGSYANGTQDLDRLAVTEDYPEPVFVDDQYDLTSYAGRSSAIRFSYSTDGGLAKPGWFIDDVRIVAGNGEVLYDSDFESGAGEDAIFNGGCQGDFTTSDRCTDGWRHLNAADRDEADRAYYLEMRDRSGFDATGRGENDRTPIAFSPGLLLVYTDESSGYGNTGETSGNAPNQSPLDSVPQVGNTNPNLNDAAFTGTAGDTWFSDSKIPATPTPAAPAKAQPNGWIDNYKDEHSSYADKNWHFDFSCLTFTVLRMAGTDIALPFNLEGDARFNLGTGCAAFDYGFGVPNTAPTAVAQAKPTSVVAGEPVTFDGSGSFDDKDAATQLTYSWDVDGDGTHESSGDTLTHAYNRPGTFNATLKVTDRGGLTDTDTVVITVSGSDLRVSALTATGHKDAREGDRVTVTATVRNDGTAPAPATSTEFLLDGRTVLGLVETPALAPGASAQVSVAWDTRGANGDHVIKATADKANVVGEASETNNSSTLSVTVKGNKVTNGSFEEGSGGAPAAWTGSSTSGGTASWNDSGSGGSKGAAMSGNGGSALAGSPTWTSAPVDVGAGEIVDLRASVSAFGASSAPSVSVVYLSALGDTLETVQAATASVATPGFQTLGRQLTVPVGVAKVKIVLTAFAPTDTATAGTVTFDDVGLFAR